MSPEIFKAPDEEPGKESQPEGQARIYPEQGNQPRGGGPGSDQPGYTKSPGSQFNSKNSAEERHYTLSVTDENRQKSFDTEDKRWATNLQLRDWIILLIAILFWVGFQLSFYFLEPGLR